MSEQKTLKSRTPGILEPFFLLFLPLLFLFPALVSAEGIYGTAELSYSIDNEKAKDSSGNETETETKTFTQRYTLTLDKTIYPNLSFLATGTFEKIKSDLTINGQDSESTFTTKNGILRLRLNTQLITSGIGFSRREERVTSSSGNTVPRLMDVYDASLFWSPADLPSLNAIFTRTDTYDKNRDLENRLSDYLSLTLRYDPVRDLSLQGSTSFNDTKDKVGHTETKTTSYQGKATYSRRLGERVSTYATYSFFRQETETTAQGSGEVLFQVFPFFGLSAIDDMPTLVTLDNNPALIDGDLNASSGINIGPVPPLGDARPRQIGLDFINPSEVNRIYVWVDRELPAAVSNAFSWDVYISSDNENWTLWQTVPSAPFGGFYDRFEISFSTVSARYLKVVTNPLPPAVVPPPGTDVSSIIVTEMQAFLTVSAEDVRGKRTQTSHVYDLNVRWQILDIPNLSYNFYGWGSYFDPGGLSKYVITNSLNVTHRFNRVFSGAARISREDTKDEDWQSANVIGASLTAAPLPTLFHRLTWNSRFEETRDGSRNSHSVSLNNTAQLYEGINLLLNGGASVTNSETDRKTVSLFLTSGTSIVPHRRVGLNMTYTQTNTEQTGGGMRDTSTDRRTFDLGVSYTPFDTLYLFASYQRVAETDRETTDVQNYALTWSPFPGGDLLFNFTYNESINSDGTKDRTLSPSLIWYVRGGTQLQASYQYRKSTSPVLETRGNIWYMSLRVAI